MAQFLIEFRLHGYAREYARWARARTLREAQKLGVRRLREPRFVPHITLFGPAEANRLRNVVREVERVGRNYTLVPFEVGVRRGEFRNEDVNWLYLDVQPSPQLEQFRHELAESLLRLETKVRDTCQHYDRNPTYKFHCSIGRYDARHSARFEKLADYAETRCTLEAFKERKVSLFGRLLNIVERCIVRAEGKDEPRISQHLLRVTVLGKRGRIKAEYDLVLSKTLSRSEALSRYWWRSTIERTKGFRTSPPEEHVSISSKSVYFIGDTHFDHKNIIRYCRRPFSDVNEMNQTIENNWNTIVRDNEIVYFLGDWSFGRGSKSAAYWMRRMKGNIFSIQGSHDKVRFDISRVLHVGGYSFLLIHDPKNAEIEWDGWTIHGHVHNNRMDEYPFINGERRTINVSAELIGYKPVSLEHLLSLDLDSIRRMRTIDSEPERW